MSNRIILPKRTNEYLANGAPEGQRHEECKQAALQLHDAGVSRSEAELLLFDRGERDGLKRLEVENVISWAYSQNPRTPIVIFDKNGALGLNRSAMAAPAAKPRPPLDHAKWWLSGKEMTEADFSGKSQLTIPENRVQSLKLFLEMLYEGADQINVVCKFLDEDGKARPHGGGKVLTRDDWMTWIDQSGIPQREAGAWFRPNPCQPGTGKAGAVMDSDILAHRFLLLESDVLPLPVQMALFSKLKLPISTAYFSGGMSIHCLVNIGCKSAQEFSEKALRITSALKPFGIDQANKNPSRLSRLPGAIRIIGAPDPLGCEQKLLWLNPAAQPLTDEGLESFENSLTFPAVEEKPFRSITLEAIARYEELNSNPGKRGVPTGMDDFDNDTGGLHPGQMTVIAAVTNGGKSSLVLNMLNAALHKGHGAALFSLEMMNDEIADILFSMNCRIDRNHFNTGRFTNDEMVSMTGNVQRLAALKLWTFDQSSLTAKEIRTRILALKTEGLIDLAIVDYAQIVTPENYDLSREQQVAGIARALCACAKDAKIPILVLSQLNDEFKLRESRVISHEAHNVLYIENHENEGKLIMKVVKGRRIRKKDYTLFYEPKFCIIGSMAKTDESRYQPTINDP